MALINLDTFKGYWKKVADWVDGTGSPNVKLTGCIVQEQKTQADAVANVLTFTENISSIEIYHSEATPQAFIVNGITLTIADGGWRSAIGGTPGKTVTIPAGVNCIVSRLV
jgi:hypothetical protein